MHPLTKRLKIKIILYIVMTLTIASCNGGAFENAGSAGGSTTKEAGGEETSEPDAIAGFYLTYENATLGCTNLGDNKIQCQLFAKQEDGTLVAADSFSDGTLATWGDPQILAGDFTLNANCNSDDTDLIKTWCVEGEDSLVGEFLVAVDLFHKEKGQRAEEQTIFLGIPALESFSLTNEVYTPISYLISNNGEAVTGCDFGSNSPRGLELSLENGSCKISGEILSPTSEAITIKASNSSGEDISEATIEPTIETVFISKWDIQVSQLQLELPLRRNDQANQANITYTIDWGDGNIEIGVEENNLHTHIYENAGEYTVKIYGRMPNWTLNGFTSTAAVQLKEISKWGRLRLEPTGGSQFRFASNLTITAGGANDLLNTDHVINMGRMFQGCSEVTNIADINDWNTSGVTDMNSIFRGATKFNANIGEWDTSKVIDMHNMFYDAPSFNQDISNWNTSQVTDMDSMFHDATNFNQEINTNEVNDHWVVSQVVSMQKMFEGAVSFDRSIADWDVSSVTNMTNIFSGAVSFDQNLESWDVSSVGPRNAAFSQVQFSTNNYNAVINNWGWGADVGLSEK